MHSVRADIVNNMEATDQPRAPGVPKRVPPAVVIGVLVVIVIILAVVFMHYRSKKTKSGFWEGLATTTPTTATPAAVAKAVSAPVVAAAATLDACRQEWDPAALAEVQALASIGAVPSYGQM